LPVRLSDAERARIVAMVEQAQSAEEIEALERMLAAGELPRSVAAAPPPPSSSSSSAAMQDGV
jgi:hypothetical protein